MLSERFLLPFVLLISFVVLEIGLRFALDQSAQDNSYSKSNPSKWFLLARNFSMPKPWSKPVSKEVDLADNDVNNWGPYINVTVRKDRHRNVNASELKTILFWHKAYNMIMFPFTKKGREPFFEYRCPETRCFVTDDRTYLSNVADFDAVVFHQREATGWHNHMPPKRKTSQRYVMWVIEPAHYLYMDVRSINNMFNWTMTYKLNSDIPFPYGRIQPTRPHPTGRELDTYIKEFGEKNRHLAKGKGKDLKAVWFVSNCYAKSGRENYVQSLRKHGVHVDVVGKCGVDTIDCPRSQKLTCYEEMSKEIKFYLSFENSVCDDYVTEKYYNVLHTNMIPVVFGGAEYSPYRAYVHTFNYTSVSELVRRLREIHEDDAKYAEHFWWRDFYEVRNSPEDTFQPWCQLCQALHDEGRPQKVYPDMEKWWVKDSHCRRPTWKE